MSRLSTMSAAALRAVFSPEAEDSLIILITIYNPSNHSEVLYRICDNFMPDPLDPTKALRLSTTTDDQVFYGVQLADNTEFTFLPIEVTLPNEDETQSPRCSLTMHDVTQYLIPFIRNSLTGPAPIKLELVLASAPDTVEASFTGLMITNISYNANTVTADLTAVNYDREPFPKHSMSPLYFPGLF